MIKVSILYPFSAEARFDFDYYTQRHMPRSIELLSSHSGFRGVTIERGIGGSEPDSSPGYVAACFYVFDSLESFADAFVPHADELQADMVNYTDITPEIQINDILIEKSAAA